MTDSFEEIKNKVDEIEKNPTSLKEEFDKNKKTGIYLIVKYLQKKYRFKTLAGKNSNFDELYVYQNGVYEQGKADKVIRTKLAEILKSEFDEHIFNATRSHITASTYFEGKRKDFEEKNTDLICLENGILNIRTKELIPHSPKYIFLSKLPVEFNPEAKCPIIEKFINDVFQKEDKKTIQEWGGYLLYRKNIFKKAMFILGEKNTGKSTYINLLRKFVGEENSTSVSLQDICTNRFAVSDLEGKLFNFFPDLKYIAMRDVGMFKIITGNDTVSGDVKFGERKVFYNYSKSVFSANRVPETKNESVDDAYYIRWLLIFCDNTFPEGDEKRDNNLIEKMTTKEELSGFLNWSLDGLERLLKNQRFSYQLNLEEVKDIMEKSSSVLKGFVSDELERADNSDWIAKKSLYEEFKSYASQKGRKIISVRKFGNQIPIYAPYIDSGWHGQNKVWRNVRFKNPEKIINRHNEMF